MRVGDAAIVTLFDVDNTLLDNDRVIADLMRYLERELGKERQARYWALFEELRAELGYADYLGALQRYRVEYPDDPHVLAMSEYLIEYPFANRLFPGSLDVVDRAKEWGSVAILTDGDAVYSVSSSGVAVEHLLVAGLAEVSARRCARALDPRRGWWPASCCSDTPRGQPPAARHPAGEEVAADPVNGVAQVDDNDFVAGVEHGLELFGSDAGDAQIAEKFAAHEPLADDPAGDSSDDQHGEPTAEAGRVFGDGFNLFAEDVASAENAESPDEGAEGVEEQKFARAHVKNASERGSNSA